MIKTWFKTFQVEWEIFLPVLCRHFQGVKFRLFNCPVQLFSASQKTP